MENMKYKGSMEKKGNTGDSFKPLFPLIPYTRISPVFCNNSLLLNS